MKQCPNCRRTYPDNLAYCLEDGAALVAAYDPEATQVHTPAPLSNLPPTEVYPKLPPTEVYQVPTPPAPAPRPKSRAWLVGVVVLAALVVGLVVGGLLFKQSSSDTSSSNSPAATPTSTRTTTPATTPTPGATATPAVVTATATPMPSPAVTPSPLATPSPAKVESECMLRNDKADREGVRVRLNCDTQDCDTDESTIAGEYPDETPISIIRGSSVRGKRFTWVKVVILQTKRTVWVASTKIKC